MHQHEDLLRILPVSSADNSKAKLCQQANEMVSSTGAAPAISGAVTALMEQPEGPVLPFCLAMTVAHGTGGQHQRLALAYWNLQVWRAGLFGCSIHALETYI